MIAFRDETARRLWALIFWSIPIAEGLAAGVGPFTHGSAVHTDIMKTQALKQALDKGGLRCGLRRRPPGRGEVSRERADFLVPVSGAHRWDPKAAAPRTLAALQCTQEEQGRIYSGVSVVQLDRARHMAIYPPRRPCRLVPLYFAAPRPVGGCVTAPWIMVDDDRMPLAEGEAPQLRAPSVSGRLADIPSYRSRRKRGEDLA